MHRIWSDIPSLFQVIGTMSCLGMWIPRATMFTDMTSAWWVSVSLTILCVSLLTEPCR